MTNDYQCEMAGEIDAPEADWMNYDELQARDVNSAALSYADRFGGDYTHWGRIFVKVTPDGTDETQIVRVNLKTTHEAYLPNVIAMAAPACTQKI